jgi:predicted RNA-binding Zn-ribbon protein involved in translation (DUF1610 family)
MVNKKSCPKCGSEKIDFYAGALTGAYHCKKCGYTGPIIVEEDDITGKKL